MKKHPWDWKNTFQHIAGRWRHVPSVLKFPRCAKWPQGYASNGHLLSMAQPVASDDARDPRRK